MTRFTGARVLEVRIHLPPAESRDEPSRPPAVSGYGGCDCRPDPSNRARQKARQPASPRPRTRSSNPVPSSRESTNFRFLGHRRAPPAWFLPEELCRFSGHTAMEPNRGVRGAALCPCPHHLTETTARHFLPHLRYRSRSLRSRTLTAGLSPALNRTPVGSCAWRVPLTRGCIEYGPAINAEGIGGLQTKFRSRRL